MSTYSELQTQLVDLLSEDTQVDEARARQYIAIAEPKIDRDLLDTGNGGAVPRQKLSRRVETVGSDGTYDLPADYHEARAVLVSGLPMRYASPELVPFNDQGQPQNGYANATIQLDYYQRLPVLSDTTTTNWLLDVGFDVYLYGSALQWIAWGQETDNFQLWTTFYRDALRTTKMTHKASPRGGRRRQNGAYYKGFYTVVGEKMYFGRAH